jgi:hypothetical protein
MFRTQLLALCVIAAFGATSALAADAAGEPPKKNEQAAKPKKKKAMKMTEPIANEMKKEGMIKGDVKKAAEQKDAEMKPMMREEEKTMPSR